MHILISYLKQRNFSDNSMSFHSYNDYNSGGLFLSNYASTGLGLGGLGSEEIFYLLCVQEVVTRFL